MATFALMELETKLSTIKQLICINNITHPEIGEKMGIGNKGVTIGLSRSPTEHWINRLEKAVKSIIEERLQQTNKITTP